MLYPAPAGLGVGTKAHRDPFHRALSGLLSTNPDRETIPTARQSDASVHETDPSWPDARMLGTAVHAAPFQCSIRTLNRCGVVVGCRATAVEAPTAVQSDGAGSSGPSPS